MGDAAEITFKDILERQKTWTDYSYFCGQIPDIISKEVAENTKREKKLVEDIRNSPAFQKVSIRDAGPQLETAERLLVGGDVVGVDGTMAKYRFLSGVRCQIGVVAVNYQGDHIRHSFFISRSDLWDETEDVLGRIFQRTEGEEGLSDLHLRGLMEYRERQAGMDPKFAGKYVMYHGSLLPFELMSGLGRLRALDTTLELLREMIRSKRVMSVISSSSFKDYMYFGRAIESGQYLTYDDYNMETHLIQTSDFMQWSGKWRDDERAAVETFIKDYASQVSIGVIRIGDRPYVFHAHKDIFDLAAAIIARDAMFQREKGFPLLIDYADSMCSTYFSASQFNRMVDWQLARAGEYLAESGERKMRAK